MWWFCQKFPKNQGKSVDGNGIIGIFFNNFMELAAAVFHFLQYRIDALRFQKPVFLSDPLCDGGRDQDLRLRKKSLIVKECTPCVIGLTAKDCRPDGKTESICKLSGIDGVLISKSGLTLRQDAFGRDAVFHQDRREKICFCREFPAAVFFR